MPERNHGRDVPRKDPPKTTDEVGGVAFPDFAHMDLEEGYKWPVPPAPRDGGDTAERTDEAEQ